MQHPPLQKRRRVRRHRVPFPLTDTAELFEGGEILRDFESEIAVVLWKSYKNVMLWAGAHPEERGSLFASGAGERRREDVRATPMDPVVERPLLELAALLDAPGAAESVAVGRACRALSEWAAARDASASALLFMQAAALASPLDADAAVTVGRMARNRAEYARAETWFRHAICVSRQVADWSAYTRAYVGIGKVFWQRGALPSARRALARAYRTATRHHLQELRGWALTDLGGIAIDSGRWEEARSYIQGAFGIYGPRHPLAMTLVHDLAYAWITQGWFSPAVRVLTAIESGLTEPGDRVFLTGSLARAAGGAGDDALFDRVTVDLIPAAAQAPLVPLVWLDVAHGAASLGRWELADHAADTALRLATERGEARVRFEAEAVLDSIRGGSLARRNATREILTAPHDVGAIASELACLVEMRDEADAPLAGASAS
jgi:tetratricopeptide (TPR) repeat protein